MTVRSHRDAQGDTLLDADVVIIGSGPGGAAAARVLAEGGLRVVVVEEGPAQSRFRPNQAHTMRYHMQEGGSMVALGATAVAVAAGRGVGGGSLINSAICWRAPDPVLDGWTDVLGGDDRFRAANMGPVYDEIGDIIEVTLTPDHIAGENNKLIVRGAQALGLPSGLLHRNTPRCQGCGICNFGCPSGGKASVDTNLLALARGAGCIIQADTKVTAILRDPTGERVTGVTGEVRHPDTGAVEGRLTVRAERVVLAAGAVGTPRLLHHSGLAPQLGPAVGKGLHLHPGNGVFGLCDEPVHMWLGATQGAYFEDPELPGVLPHTMTVPPGALMLALGRAGLAAKEALAQVPYICGCLVMVSDKGEGFVGATSDGHADMTYWFADEDITMMRAGLKRTCDVLLAGGAKRLLVPVAGADWVDTAEEAHAAIDRATMQDYKLLYGAHPMATCRMGTDPETSVIKPDGEAHGLKGLYITDSSIFPTSLGVNPQWTTMTMATILARGMLAS